MMKKKMILADEEKEEEIARQKELLEGEEREENRIELQETATSKGLVSTMVKSSLQNTGETLQKAVEVLQNQNGK